MSVSSKQGGGSRASDEDGKPTVSVKVGRSSLIAIVASWLSIALLMWKDYSCAYTPPTSTIRSRLRISPATLSTVHGP